ncbi:alpha/beta hydrolase [Gorillibacterium timonense]|uniref:alpha/beta hydrolase n=1 Tax=Gorillibacterium timonense TaxID=1689269 RepID=UPI00071E21C9|nr:alpha/beta fold hydrolase [Gorillibacterium timonense]
METTFMIRQGEWELAATLHRPLAEDRGGSFQAAPLVVICHGFVGSRIGVDRLFVKTARELAGTGLNVLRFDYAGCGESEGDYGAGGLDAMVSQTRAVLDHVLAIPGIATEDVTLLGHSLGGAVAILTATIDKRVNKLVLWSPVANPFGDIVRIVGKDVYEKAMQEGRADYLGYGLTSGYFNSLSAHHPFQEARKFLGPILLVHGTGDDVIPVDYSFLYQKIFRIRRDGCCDKELVQGANHTFSSEESVTAVIDRTKGWLIGHSGPKSRII